MSLLSNNKYINDSWLKNVKSRELPNIKKTNANIFSLKNKFFKSFFFLIFKKLVFFCSPDSIKTFKIKQKLKPKTTKKNLFKNVKYVQIKVKKKFG